MTNSLRLLAPLSLVLGTAFVHADPVKEAVTDELKLIERVFETGYAPTNWKKEHIGWDRATEIAKARAQIEQKQTLSMVEYRRILKEFFQSTKDYHVGMGFHSTEKATLPFTVYSAGGKYFVVYIDDKKVSKDVFGFQPGDELVLWNGLPVQKEIDHLMPFLDWGVPTTDQRLADMTLTSRAAARAIPVPQGQVQLSFKRINKDGTETFFNRDMSWDYKPERISWNSVESKVSPMAAKPMAKNAFEIPQMKWGFRDLYMADEEDEEGDEEDKEDKQTPKKEPKEDPSEKNRFMIGGRKSFVPELGDIIWESAATDEFHAYAYRTESGKVIGYVRIPHYGAGEKSFVNFRAIIERFQKSTDALVIDEINNPGGSVFYVLALSSVLSSQPVKVPDHHISLWPAMVRNMVQLSDETAKITNDEEAQKFFGKDVHGFPITFSFARSAYDFTQDVLKSWNRGERLTRPLFLYGVDRVNPDTKVNYTKPVLVLVNQLAFSGGDFFPAILQDNKIAKVFGQRTAGAGGYVLGVSYPSSMGLAGFSFTGSLARRIDNKPIENLGVTPDILYELTENDLRNSFREYKSAINKSVDQLIAEGFRK